MRRRKRRRRKRRMVNGGGVTLWGVGGGTASMGREKREKAAGERKCCQGMREAWPCPRCALCVLY
jgi:hypothetical protein